MGAIQTQRFTKEENRVATLAKALGHPARIAIIRVLMEKRSCICGDIVDELPLSQATVSQHLKELKQAGIIQGNIDGPRVCYCLEPKTIQEVKNLLGGFLKEMDSAVIDCC